MLFGVGAVSTSTTLFEGSFLDTRMLDELISLGAVGEIGGRFFDAEGTPVDTELQQRAVSVALEDIRICESVQRGLRSRYYDRGRFSVKRENGVHHFHGLLAEFLLSHRDGGGGAGGDTPQREL